MKDQEKQIAKDLERKEKRTAKETAQLARGQARREADIARECPSGGNEIGKSLLQLHEVGPILRTG